MGHPSTMEIEPGRRVYAGPRDNPALRRFVLAPCSLSHLGGAHGPLKYAPGVDEDAIVVLTVASDEPEAEIVCGLLRSAGLECGYRDTEAVDSAFEGFAASGRREILVYGSDLEAAQALLAEAER